MLDPSQHPHRRYNPLSGEWIIVSPHRTKRPWQGQVEQTPPDTRPAYDPTCYLCPGNERAGGKRTPQYTGTYVFDNDFPALLPDSPDEIVEPDSPFFRMEGDRGICRVICFNPRHDLTLAQMDLADIRRVIDTWAEQVVDLGSREFINYVQIFENKGAPMGASNPHPHGQIWATMRLPYEIQREDTNQHAYFEAHGRTLLSDYLDEERQRDERIIYSNQHWTVLVPFWAFWPYETMLISHRPAPDLLSLDGVERDALADALHAITVRYDNLFQASFSYGMGFHQQPTDGVLHPYWHLHAHFYPPLLRSATVRKFVASYELLGTRQRDISAEMAARTLRDLPGMHYSLAK
ncbi:MAG TPA: UDP-glucose--hexose-1-phosphate uridylyltransferase [Aggregatilinea sp.]|uniref:UDP-glucose--hexose-1-phosphate uridylyltransferase n=1 Tax=Aggregatilinea sp. TaxID=2806333 RepID=UPI002B9C6961|nr:UDP-glucose--hexose-1-phosphate uridylyltransferase [Aggregatilinea sp.]HML24664.1 UDP-glucose--hexose-1-phosphate uridylyltransferase [Aggregatilinea sp.]